MKTPTATKLPSGSYRCRVWVDGKSVSITGSNKNDVEREALLLKLGSIENKKKHSITVGQAYDKYIDICSETLSPSTITGYKRLRKNTFQSIMDCEIDSLTNDQVQIAINEMIKDKASPKYIRNAYGLFTVVVKRYSKHKEFDIRLPQKKKIRYNIPNESQIEAIQNAISDTDIELPVILAIQAGLRMSEVRGLEWQDIDLQNNKIHVQRAVVDTDTGPVQKNYTKSAAGDRYVVTMPKLKELLQEAQTDNCKPTDKIINKSASAITSKFDRLCEKNDIPHFGFHSLRHYFASFLLTKNIPDIYAAAMMGHEGTTMLKQVYQQTIDEKQKEYENMLSSADTAKTEKAKE